MGAPQAVKVCALIHNSPHEQHWVPHLIRMEARKEPWFSELFPTASETQHLQIFWRAQPTAGIDDGKQSALPRFWVSQECLCCPNCNAHQVHIFALTGKNPPSSGGFTQGLFLLVTGEGEKSRTIHFQVAVMEFAATQLKNRIWLREVFFSIKEMIKQFKYSLLTKHGFFLSLVRSRVLSRAVSVHWPLPP